MQMNDSRLIAAPPETVWAALFDPQVLKACVPGCEELTGTPADGFEAVVTQKVGPVKARFTGLVTLTDIVPGQGCTITGEGKGGAAGFAKGSARVTLTPEGEGTRLDYAVEANIGGKIAQLGSRIIDGFVRKMADEFFDRFQEAVEPADEAAPEGEAPKKGWFKRLIG
ncbi:carbon monoxide dehydrogenase subunit G [Gemmobacter sp.]|uniref:CoxG family protein n=1 Tax=Gemmobacter sp. TaxID=1898957 RepID=UPI002B002001|nr:carbon monoxide dehydrogenase subunit G [Gemmobacter sp.]